MSPDRDQYLEALGIPAFLYSSEGSEVLVQDRFKLLVVELNSQDSFCHAGASQALLEKMLMSIGIGLNECSLLSIDKSKIDDFIQGHSSELILFMNSSIAAEGKTLFVTHHPKDIINNPQLKRESWEVLKKVKLCLK
jgi:DNA polymerase III psi subunit